MAQKKSSRSKKTLKSARRVERTMAAPAKPANSEAARATRSDALVVSGIVRTADGQPVAGATVEAYDQDLRRSQRLGKDTSSPDGSYRISYTAAKFARAEKRSADVRVRVRHEHTQEWVHSEIHFNAPAELMVDLTLPPVSPALSEFEILVKDVLPLLAGQGRAGADLAFTELEPKDFDFLAEETGQPKQYIAWLSQAENLARESSSLSAPVRSARSKKQMSAGEAVGIPAQAFYGWLRHDLPSVPGELWKLPTDTLIKTLRAAIHQGILPHSLDRDLEDIRQKIERIKLDLSLRAPRPGLASSLGDMLATLPVPPNLNQQRILAAATDLRPDDPKLVQRIRSLKGFDGDAVQIARTMRLDALTGGHLALTQALQPRLSREKEGTLRPLAALRADEWLDLAYAHSVPGDAGISPGEYAGQLSARIEKLHPTAVLAAHFEDGRRLAHHPMLTEVGPFLRNNPDFDIVTANLDTLSKHAKPQNVDAPDQLESGLRVLQRMQTLGASWDETAVFLENDLYSPHALLGAGPTQLTTLLEGQIPPERIGALYNQVEELHNVTFAAVTAAFAPFNAPSILPMAGYGTGPIPDPVNPDDFPPDPYTGPRPGPLPDTDGPGGSITPDPGDYASLVKFVPPDLSIVPRLPTPQDRPQATDDRRPRLPAAVNDQPTLQALFGNQDACACGHCNSVLSPAAYFVDVLRFITHAKLDWALLGRRPDLQDVELTCENANSEVPAIDLVLEILENAVALPLDVDLQPGTAVEAQLTSPTVGPEVRTALSKTVRYLSGEVQASREAGDWTVVDGHRRWKLSATAENALTATTSAGGALPLKTKGVALADVFAALDGGHIAAGAEAAFAQLFMPKSTRPLRMSNYRVEITPISPSHSWRVQYQIEMQLLIDPDTNELTLQTPANEVWWQRKYDQITIAAVTVDLNKRNMPELVKKLADDRFPNKGVFTISSAGTNRWTIATNAQAITINYEPAHIQIVSLAYQSGDPNADAIAWPENHNPEAYVRLKAPGVVFPWTLPLDLPLEEVRLFLERARSSRRKLMDLAAPLDQPVNDTAVFAREVLGLNEAEALLISQQALEVYPSWGITSNQKTLWDVAVDGLVKRTTALDLLKNVSILLQQSRLSFAELELALSTRFVNGGTPLGIEPSTTCKPSEMTVPDLTAKHLDRLHRFIRLWRKLGWTMHELDLAIQAFGGQLQPDTLLSLERLQLLREQLNIPLAHLIGGLDLLETEPWTDYPTDSVHVKHSLYHNMFQREPAPAPSDYAAFALQADKKELQNTPLLGISEHAAYIGAALGVGLQAVRDWVSTSNGIGVEDKLDRANLSRVVAAASVCRALDISPDKLTHHLKLYGQTTSPFGAGMSARERADALLKFIEKYRSIAQSQIDVETLLYLIQHHEAPSSNVPLGAAQQRNLANAVRETLHAVSDASAQASAAVSALASGLSAPPELVDELLRHRLKHPADMTKPAIDTFLESTFVNGSASQQLSDAVSTVLVRLYKAVFLCSVLTMSAADLQLLRQDSKDTHGFIVLDFNALPASAAASPAKLDDLERLLALMRLRTIATGAGDLLHKLSLIDFSSTRGLVATRKDIHSVLSDGLLLEQAQVEEAANHLNIAPAIATVDQYRNPILLTRLIELLAGLKQLGTTVAQALDLILSSPSEAVAMSARDLLHSKYGASQWHDLVRPIADSLRERQRSALIDYLIARDSLPRAGEENPQIYTGTHLRDANDLYERYLIDVQVASCMKTTRLLLATAAAQLFVQRLLLNLERRASLTSDQREIWDWMHSYRVWEANRKVFLFPENWLLPELRDDKTEIFRKMEGELGQKELSRETAREALLGYLEDFADQAQINIVAMHQEETTLYVVGRTPNQPYRYFWRACTNFGDKGMSWSGWEALDLDNANDFIMPFALEGDLHVAWPIFSKKSDEKKVDEKDPDPPVPLWKVQLAWARRTKHGWSKRKVGTMQLDQILRLPNLDEMRSFTFRLSKELSSIQILGSRPLTRETIDIDCFSARELISNAAFNPTPDLNELKNNNAPSQDWNVHCSVSGVIYRWALVDTKNNIKAYQPAKGLIIGVAWQHKEVPWPGYVHSYSSTTQTDENGRFSFNFPYPGADRSHDGEVLNGGDVTLVFIWPSGPEFATATLKSSDGKTYASWTWKYNTGHEDKSIADKYHPDRNLKYQWEGRFVIEPGQDLGSGLPPYQLPGFNDVDGFQVNGNRFALLKNPKTTLPSVVFHDAGSWNPPHPLELPLMVTLATGVSLGESPILYVQDKQGGSYLQKRGNSWYRWPNGQPFASSYRTAAILSTAALFEPGLEAHLHTDDSANNFGRTNSYANYNWELFLHVPLAIADHFAGQQRFADARRWLHAVFDPTATDTDPKNPIARYWRFLPFRSAAQPDSIAKLLTWLADPVMIDPKDTQEIEEDLKAQIDEWKKNPFMPHVIARLRPSAYQWHAFFAYLDVLIGWGDQLFRRDTRESVNDATLLYVLAAKLLGPRPRVIPAPTPLPAQTYRSLLSSPNGIDEFGNVWLHYADLPGIRLLASSQPESATSSQSFALTSSTRSTRSGYAPGYEPAGPAHLSRIQILTSLSALAFCIPQNEKLTAYYDLIEKRLFEVRNCRNIEGTFRELPLYDPPIDPLLLIRARAAGLDIDTVIAELTAPMPNYRFNFTLQKALELAAELKALGGALLAALEKGDAEELALLRSSHELSMLKLVREIRQKQVDEADANLLALQQSEETLIERFGQYQKLLGKPGMTKGQDGLPVVEQSSSLSVASDPVGGASGLGLSSLEIQQLLLTARSNEFHQLANAIHLVAGILSLVPDIFAGTPFAGQTFGGSNLGIGANAIAQAMEMGATETTFMANLAGTFGGYQRRQDEWVHQSKLALAELKQLEKQIIAAQIRKEIAQHELDNHDAQIENAQAVDEFMRSKFTSQQLFRWSSAQIADVYFRTYQLALDQAKRAEKAFQFELGADGTTARYMKSGQWDSLKRGLLAGEHLYHDLKRMESAYLEQNTREFELTKHISLSMLNPLALVTLRETGSCSLDLPEEIFDLDYPGHYFRRIKSVSMTLPCVVGPYTTISCTLRLTKNSIRINTTDGTSGYGRNSGADDSRFISNNIPVSAIAASGAQNDSGMFELNFHDERYLPFEGAGAVSSWSLELFNDPDPNQKDFGKPLRQYDYRTIPDVILHINYTAKEADAEFKKRAVGNLRAYFRTKGPTPALRIFNLRQEFPTQWHRFLHPADPATGNTFELEMSPDFFPFRDSDKTLKINVIYLLARCTKSSDYVVTLTPPLQAATVPTTPEPNKLQLSQKEKYGGLHFDQRGDTDHPLGLELSPTAPLITWKLSFSGPGPNGILRLDPTKKVMEVEDVFLVLGYQWK